MTPEGKVKAKIKKILNSWEVYYFMPATYGYGSSGIPDLVACFKGRFIAIECKANGNKPTPLQERNLHEISRTGGAALVINEYNIDLLVKTLEEINELDKVHGHN